MPEDSKSWIRISPEHSLLYTDFVDNTSTVQYSIKKDDMGQILT